MRGYIQPRRIRLLYEKGPEAIGAWHPPGYHAEYIAKYAAEFARSNYAELKASLTVLKVLTNICTSGRGKCLQI